MTAPQLLPPNVDYTSKDFQALRTRLFELIRSVFPAWTDTSIANFGNILIELFAFTGDVLLFYQDNQAREAFLPTARQRRSLLALSRLVGYSPAGATAATVDVSLTFDPAPTGTLTIPAGDRVATREITAPIFYQLLADITVQPSVTGTTVSVENSASPTPAAFTSTGAANQEYVLPSYPYLDGSARVTDSASGAYPGVADGWREVENLLSSTAVDRHYLVVVDERDRASVRFGNGVNGRVPSGVVTVAYKTGGGSAGRVEAGALTRMEKPVYYDSLGNLIRVSVTNPSASVGGEDRQSNASIRVNAPEALRVLRRAVSREDYEVAAQQIPGVARALAVTSNEMTGVGENELLLLIATADGAAPSQALLDQVEALFAPDGPYPRPNTLRLRVQAAPYLDINVAATLYLAPGASTAAVRTAVEGALEGFFAPLDAEGAPNTSINFGYYFQDADGNPTGRFAWSDVHNAVRDTSGVGRIDPGPTGFTLNGLRADVLLSAIQFPRLGTVTLVDGDTSLSL